MSLPAPAASDESNERRRSLGKYVKRMSSVFKRGGSSRPSAPASTSTATPATAPATTAAPETTTPAAPASASAPVATYQYNRSAVQQERARALFAKYGLTLESHEWITPAASNVQRVEKPIRMRVHRTCHRCETTFGQERVCAKCQHKRCKKCPRYPKKKVIGDNKDDLVTEQRPKKKMLLTIKSKTGGDLVYQPTKQRVRRTCHKCESFFNPPTATVCEKCEHVRCTRCPRDPAKLKKWPDGYPGDAPAEDSETELDNERPRRMYRRPRQKVRWECEECQTLFVDGASKCEGCGHDRCDTCQRKPPKKNRVQKEFDPEIVKSVEEKLARFKVGETPTSVLAA
ncbi:hypothetical protein BU16DRAFT_67594 [Lophium mytilinum]|uniref:Uncharacterized protein n=1 Tax=Lophium mytilinum TaxID=390894 RepID=A0A6A6QTG4_9PEZI|nr:hypothetical protein BU16DRAFT_67594 [Lophium mytilinum]